jgi:hypothetical protein
MTSLTVVTTIVSVQEGATSVDHGQERDHDNCEQSNLHACCGHCCVASEKLSKEVKSQNCAIAARQAGVCAEMTDCFRVGYNDTKVTTWKVA